MQLRKIVAIFFVVFISLGATAFAAASHWQLWGEVGTSKLYYDLASLKRSGDVLTVTQKQMLPQADAKGVQTSIYHREYNIKKRQGRTVARYLYNAKGKFLLANKKIEPWEKIKAKTEQAAQLEYLLASSRAQGPWTRVKAIGDVAVKYYNPETLTSPKAQVVEVWEKLALNKVSQETKTIVTFVRYDVAQGKAQTLYTCNYNAAGELISANSEVDNWTSDNDTYGEYIGQDLWSIITSQKVHKR